MIAFLMAVGTSSYFITFLFDKYNRMPVITSLSPTPAKISEFPFPAVTVCNMNVMRRSEAENIFYAAENNLYSEAEIDEKLVYDFCNRDPPKRVAEKTINISAPWDYIQKFMINISQPCHEMFMYCEWHGDRVECTDFFNPSLTDEGICCVFNRLKRDFIFKNPRDLSDLNITFPGESYDWTPERGYQSNISFDVLPRRARGPGTHMGLTIVINAELDEYFCATDNSQGFKIMLNNPTETPKISSFAISVEAGKETKLVIEPKLTTASDQMRGIDKSKRQCYFETERQLFFYRTYSQNGCNLECEANFTIRRCGCVLYHMPKNASTRICGKKDDKCIKDAKSKPEILEQSDDETSESNRVNRIHQCDCLPACNEITYGFALSSSRITDAVKIDRSMLGRYNQSYFKQNMAIIRFYFMEKQYPATIRGVLFGFTEFLSNTGGLLGLFLGFSFLSAVEIAYFLTFRVCFENRKTRQAEIDVEKVENRKAIRLDITDPAFIIRKPLPFRK
ncbi:hypothetical protein O3M35_002744 [Rhynocoris fuscipes]|uniref:Pickpocket protein 28 n=1 Tax=Rhynocoris fuscipes TaxID=488301 RepID=A0AAW1CLE2_9HEMI